MFDTVGAIGLQKELTALAKVFTKPQPVKNIFGFEDTRLGEHIERAYHALAINETRSDFVSSCFLDGIG